MIFYSGLATSNGDRDLGQHLYNSVIFEGATLVYWPDCNASDGCHSQLLLAVTAARGIAEGTI